MIYHVSLLNIFPLVEELFLAPIVWTSLCSTIAVESLVIIYNLQHRRNLKDPTSPPKATTNAPSTPPKMSVSPNHLRSLYRSLLRELPPRPILRSPRAPLHNRLRESISSSTATSSSATTATNINKSTTDAAEAARAGQLVAYLKSQRKYVTLLERYNPGMNMDEEERIRLTARRVGMDLPLEYTTEEE